MIHLCCVLVSSICLISLFCSGLSFFFFFPVSTKDCLEGWSWVSFQLHFSYHSNPSMWAHVCKNEEIISTLRFCELVSILFEYDQRLSRREFLAGTLLICLAMLVTLWWNLWWLPCITDGDEVVMWEKSKLDYYIGYPGKWNGAEADWHSLNEFCILGSIMY